MTFIVWVSSHSSSPHLKTATNSHSCFTTWGSAALRSILVSHKFTGSMPRIFRTSGPHAVPSDPASGTTLVPWPSSTWTLGTEFLETAAMSPPITPFFQPGYFFPSHMTDFAQGPLPPYAAHFMSFARQRSFGPCFFTQKLYGLVLPSGVADFCLTRVFSVTYIWRWHSDVLCLVMEWLLQFHSFHNNHPTFSPKDWRDPLLIIRCQIKLVQHEGVEMFIFHHHYRNILGTAVQYCEAQLLSKSQSMQFIWWKQMFMRALYFLASLSPTFTCQFQHHRSMSPPGNHSCYTWGTVNKQHYVVLSCQCSLWTYKSTGEFDNIF